MKKSNDKRGRGAVALLVVWILLAVIGGVVITAEY
jgi:hypothetical protein